MKTITTQMIEDWMGSDNMSVDAFLELLALIANKKYAVDLFAQEVLEYNEEEV
jgi:hypothetical protein